MTPAPIDARVIVTPQLLTTIGKDALVGGAVPRDPAEVCGALGVNMAPPDALDVFVPAGRDATAPPLVAVRAVPARHPTTAVRRPARSSQAGLVRLRCCPDHLACPAAFVVWRRASGTAAARVVAGRPGQAATAKVGAQPVSAVEHPAGELLGGERTVVQLARRDAIDDRREPRDLTGHRAEEHPKRVSGYGGPDSDGWFPTGDIAVRDNDGHLILLGRCQSCGRASIRPTSTMSMRTPNLTRQHRLSGELASGQLRAHIDDDALLCRALTSPGRDAVGHLDDMRIPHQLGHVHRAALADAGTALGAAFEQR